MTRLTDHVLSSLGRAETPRSLLVGSVLGHIVIAIILIVGIPAWRTEIPVVEPIMVDVLDPSDLTVATNTRQDKPKQETKRISDTPNTEKPKPKPTPVKSTQSPESVDTPPPLDPSEAEEIPDDTPPPPVPNFKPKPPEPKAEPIEEPEVEKKPEPKQDFASVLKNLVGEEEPESAPSTTPDVPAPVIDNTKPASMAPTTGETLSISEIDMLKQQIARCWSIPIGAVQAEDLSVELDIRVAPDRRVISADIVDTSRYNRDPFFRTAAESARRAVLSPACSPLALPPEKGHLWNHMRIRFNPNDMFGGM